jgi:hypothetical protein
LPGISGTSKHQFTEALFNAEEELDSLNDQYAINTQLMETNNK